VRLPFALILSHARRSWFRSLLTLGSVFIAIFVFGAMRTVVDSLEAAVKGTSAQRMMTESAVSLFVNLPRRLEQQIEAVPGVKAVNHWTWFAGTYVHPENFFARFGTDPKTMRVVFESDVEMPAEQWKAFEETRTGCIIGENLKAEYGWDVGSRIPLQGSIFPGEYELVVVGVYRTKSTSFDPSTLFFQWEYLNEMSKKNDGKRDIVSVFAMLLEDPKLGPAVIDGIDERFANSDTRTRTMTERAFQAQFLSMWGNLPFFFNFLSAVALTATLMVTLNTMLLNARERVKEVGVVKTLGFTNGAVLTIFLVESTVLCIAGGLLGTAAFQSLDGMVLPVALLPMFVKQETNWMAVALSVVLGLVSGLAPSVGASRLKIVDALRRHD
jgi:putative ABC transport system permease protein